MRIPKNFDGLGNFTALSPEQVLTPGQQKELSPDEQKQKERIPARVLGLMGEKEILEPLHEIFETFRLGVLHAEEMALWLRR